MIVAETELRTQYLGLAPFLRASISGEDLRPQAQNLLAQTAERPDDAPLLMNLSLALQCLGQRDIGLALQAQALEIQRIYTLEATDRPPRLRVLMLMSPGDISSNTPLECLLETGDIELIHYYLTPGNALAEPVPDHDIVMAALGESAGNRAALQQLERALQRWPQPVVNAPEQISATDRQVASEVLQGIPGLVIPRTFRARRDVLQQIAASTCRLPDAFEGAGFPIILRPVGSHAGNALEKLTSTADLSGYLSRVEGEEFFLARFVDYRSPDGYFRKFRIALVDGAPYVCHVGVSRHWMVHYLNAGMYEDAWRRSQEAAFMADFAAFALRHATAIAAIHERIPLDYVLIDGAETPDRQFLIFEIDHCMVAHAMDSIELFPYKQRPMQQLKAAVEDFLWRRHEGGR